MSNFDAAVSAAERCITLLQSGAPIGSDELVLIAEASGYDAAPFRRRPKSGYVFAEDPAPIVCRLRVFIRNTRRFGGMRGQETVYSVLPAR